MDNKNKNIIKDDLSLLRCRLFYRMLFWIIYIVIILFCYWLFNFIYDASSLHSQGKITEIEYSKRIDEIIGAFIKISFVLLPFGLFAYLRLRHIKSILFYRKELGLDLDHNKTASGNPASPDARA